MKIIDFSKKNGKKNLLDFLEKRRSGFSVDTAVVDKIIKDVKKKRLNSILLCGIKEMRVCYIFRKNEKTSRT